MKSRTLSKTIAFALNVLSFVAMLVPPFVVVSEKFPAWNASGGILTAIGGGGVVMLVIAFFTFKKYILAYATEKLGAISAGVSLLLLWSGFTVVLIVLDKSATLLDDLITVFLWAAIGAAVGVVMQVIARYLCKRVSGNGEN